MNFFLTRLKNKKVFELGDDDWHTRRGCASFGELRDLHTPGSHESSLKKEQTLTYWLTRPGRRGVRSDAQLSCTETRIQKSSQSGRNSSKHPMLSISMANNVISCKKKSKETLKKPKSLILQCKFGARALKWPKIAEKTDHFYLKKKLKCGV